MEMPVYHLPSARNVFMTTWHRLKGFISRAGKTIVVVVVVLSFLNSWGTDGSFGNEDSEVSVLSAISKKATPLLAPMGIQEDNWPATVGVITGIFAKEAVVGTLDSLYADVANVESESEGDETLFGLTQAAFVSIWDNFLGLAGTFTDPLGIKVSNYQSIDEAAAEQEVRKGTLTTMAELFVTPFAAFCYLVFILLYTPCVAAMGALVREAGSKWSWVVITWSSVLAYGAATILYQVGTFAAHPGSSMGWILGMFALLAVYIALIRQIGKPDDYVQTDLIAAKNI
jgi:ferrous iron transport protein B